MSSIFGIAKTSPGAGFKKIFKIFLSPKYDNYIWHAAYEMEKEFNFRFQMTNIFGTRLMNLKKMFNFRFQMTNIFGTGLMRWKNMFANDKHIWHSADQEQKRQISNGMYLRHSALQSWFQGFENRLSVQYIWHWALRLTFFYFARSKSLHHLENFCQIFLPFFFSRGHRKG